MRAILTTNARNGAELMRFKGEAPHPILLWEIGVILCIYIPPSRRLPLSSAIPRFLRRACTFPLTIGRT